MKKVYLFLVALLGMFISDAQTFKVYYDGKEINELIEIVPEEGGMSTDYFDIENVSSSDVTFKVQLVKVQLSEGSTVMMCFGDQCLADTISGTQTLTAGEKMEHHFDLQYIYGDDVKSTVVVNFLDANDAVLYTFTVKYVIENSTANIAQTEKAITLSAVAQPNPASAYTNIRYSVPAKYKAAQLVIRNSLGKVIKQQNIKTGATGKAYINLSDFANGVYFYSIVADGTPLTTKKLIVKH